MKDETSKKSNAKYVELGKYFKLVLGCIGQEISS